MSPQRYLLDVMCGGLASYLRMCGHDNVYALDRGIEDDDRLLAIAHEEGRALITRDRRLAARTDTAILSEKTDTESHTVGHTYTNVQWRFREHEASA